MEYTQLIVGMSISLFSIQMMMPDLSLAEQARWLKTDLSSTDKWKIVILHHPLYTSEENHFGGFENLQKAFEPVFLSENVSVVFNGHVHAYETN